jgi:hypothetical protein
MQENGEVKSDTVKIYTMEHITAKMKWGLNKLFPTAGIVSTLKNLSDEKLLDFMGSIGVNISNINEENNLGNRSKLINDLREVSIAQYTVNPLEELRTNFEKAVEFCILCIDKRKTTAQENGQMILDTIMKAENWEHQCPKLLFDIIDVYIPSVGITA